MSKVRLRIIHQIDIGGPITGGVDSLIRSIIANAPGDFDVSVIGLTSDPTVRPSGQWSTVNIGHREVRFFPVGNAGIAMKRNLIPLTVRLMLGIFRYQKSIFSEADIFDFHRIEPILVCPTTLKGRAFNLYMHQDMEVINSSASDIKWKHFPSAYFALERFAIHKVQSIFCVRSSAVSRYRIDYANRDIDISFLQTWADEKVFYQRSPEDVAQKRRDLRRSYDLKDDEKLVVWVGRFDLQKDPILAIQTFSKVLLDFPSARMIMIGDGVLRSDMDKFASNLRIESNIIMTGLLSPNEIANILTAGDVYFMSSAYEGMPISVIEAISSGLPVVSTDVGEVGSLVSQGFNGYIATGANDLSHSIVKILNTEAKHMTQKSFDISKKLESNSVRKQIYDRYRKLAQRINYP